MHDSQASLLDAFKRDAHDWQPLIDMTNYKHDLKGYTDKAVTRFALYKMQQINPHFFSDAENRVLNPANPGVLSYVVYGATGVPLSVLGYYGIRNKMMFKKNFLLFSAGAFAAGYVINRIPNRLNELAQDWKRNTMAEEYSTKLGMEKIREMVDPRFPVEKLKAMANH